MTEDLAQMSCEECPVGTPKMTDEEIHVQRKQTPGWLIASCDRVRMLEREYEFDNFTTALAFTNVIGALAEQEGHYPELVTEWGNVRVDWYTPEIDGLHRNDFIMAAKTDVAYREFVSQRTGMIARGKKKKKLDFFEQLLEESPMIQEMREQWRAEGFLEGRREVFLSLIRTRYPDLAELAQQQANHIKKLDVIELLIKQVMTAPDASIVRRLLESGPQL